MLTPDPALDLPAALRLPLVVLASAVAGAVNSIAGGGTLLTFPALVGLGIPPIIANATSTVALWPGALGSMWGYRRELEGARRWAIAFAIPSLTGGLLGAQGAITARVAGGGYRVAPALIGTASASDGSPDDRYPLSATGYPLLLLFGQFLVAIYGGYFGAGVGILMLAVLGFAGFTNIHQMNGLKNWGGLCMNAVAAMTFAFSGIVNWPVALAMAVGATVGGYGGSRLAQGVSQRSVRRAIVVIGLTSGVWLMVT